MLGLVARRTWGNRNTVWTNSTMLWKIVKTYWQAQKTWRNMSYHEDAICLKKIEKYEVYLQINYYDAIWCTGMSSLLGPGDFTSSPRIAEGWTSPSYPWIARWHDATVSSGSKKSGILLHAGILSSLNKFWKTSFLMFLGGFHGLSFVACWETSRPPKTFCLTVQANRKCSITMDGLYIMHKIHELA